MDPAYEKQVGKNLRTLREKAGLTQEKLATMLQLQGCDLTRSAIAKIEVGQRHLYVYEIKLFKEALRADYEEIFK